MVKKANSTDKKMRMWWVSNIVSTILVIILIGLWIQINYRQNISEDMINTPIQLKETVSVFIQKNPVKNQPSGYFIIPTGIYVQSFEFTQSNTVQISGYVWQKFHKNVLKAGVKPGIVFPDAKTIGSIKKAYDYNDDDYRLIGWRFFGVSLLQSFDYSNYPFDIQVIKIRFWPNDFFHYMVLTPDLSSYTNTEKGHLFALNNDIVKQGFKFKETYFDLITKHYTTSFGDPMKYLAQNNLELYFNVVVKRDLINAFLIHFLPIFGIWCVLFAITMIISNDKKFAERVGLSTTQIFAALAGVIFSVILMSNNLRQQYLDQPILFMEYFYLITFFIIILVSCDAYLVTSKSKLHNILHHNLLPKTLFWPFILICLIAVTILKFYIF